MQVEEVAPQLHLLDSYGLAERTDPSIEQPRWQQSGLELTADLKARIVAENFVPVQLDQSLASTLRGIGSGLLGIAFVLALLVGLPVLAVFLLGGKTVALWGGTFALAGLGILVGIWSHRRRPNSWAETAAVIGVTLAAVAGLQTWLGDSPVTPNRDDRPVPNTPAPNVEHEGTCSGWLLGAQSETDPDVRAGLLEIYDKYCR